LNPVTKQSREPVGVRAGEVLAASPAEQFDAPPGASDADDLVHALYQDHAVTLVRMAKLLLRDQESAEDAVQDAFLGLYRALDKLTDHDDLMPYLRAAVVNRCRSVLRTRRRAMLRPVQHETEVSSPESAAMAAEERRAVLDAVSRLPRRAREVLVLRYFLDLTDEQAAATLAVSRGTVSSTASRAIAALGKALKEDL
jgi:RNA polymerase sigma-70 factor (sigma-E family)